MSQLPVTQQAGQMLEQVLIGGDLSKLNPTDRVKYYQQVCESTGLNPLTKPFEYITLNGKLTLYALRSCTEQLRKIHGVSIVIKSREVQEDCYVVIAQATDAKGRHDESLGSVNIQGLKGEARSNAMMKAETKAKRRVTLAICGLGMLDESETDSIPGSYPSPVTPTAGYLAALPSDKQNVMHETAQEVKALWGNDQAADAYALIENSNLDAEEMIALWSLLPSDIRSAHKRMKEAERAHEKGVISPAKHKRIEAKIKELLLDRGALKAWCKEQFGVDSFPKLTDEQYAKLDAHIDELPINQPATVDAQTKPANLPQHGAAASNAPSATISDKQEGELLDLLEANGISLKTFLQFGKLSALARLPADRYEKAKEWISKNKVGA